MSRTLPTCGHGGRACRMPHGPWQRWLIALLLFAASALPALAGTAPLRTETLYVPAAGLAEHALRVRVLMPEAAPPTGIRYPVLYLNDGQDLEAVALQSTMAGLLAEDLLQPLVVVAIDMPADRMAGYGLFARDTDKAIVAPTRYGPVGADAARYAHWLVHTLLPAIEQRYPVRRDAAGRGLLGWSLGAVSAFGIGWQSPELFGRVGAFSPSFWLHADGSDAASIQASRIVHGLVDASTPGPRPRLFFGVGSDEETDDRDGDGVIDVLDDVLDLMQGWSRADGSQNKGLRQHGLRINTDFGAAPDRAEAVLWREPGGRHHQHSWASMLRPFLLWAHGVHAPPLAATGTIESWQDLPSRHVPARTVDVWLPPGYADDPARRYPVIYAHDGQNLFDASQVVAGADWDLDGAMTGLIEQGRVRPAIIVGIANAGAARFAEYMPAVVAAERVETGVEGYPSLPRQALQSDAYLRFLVEELKPFIDARYRTLRVPDDTAIMGSSMGGLISLYAIGRHPQVFGAAAAVSTHWPAGGGAMVDWFAAHAPDPASHRLWFDHGTATLDATYAPFQQRMDRALRRAGYRRGGGWQSRVYPEAPHHEAAWRERAPAILEFLLGPPRD